MKDLSVKKREKEIEALSCSINGHLYLYLISHNFTASDEATIILEALSNITVVTLVTMSDDPIHEKLKILKAIDDVNKKKLTRYEKVRKLIKNEEKE